MVEIKPRPTQTKVKHLILKKYLDAWGGIIVNGLRSLAQRRLAQGKPFDLHFVYVDCFSYVGRYSGELEDEIAGRPTEIVYGSPVIGVQALDELARWAQNAGVPIRVNSILIEQSPLIYQELKATLSEVGLASRVRETMDFHGLGDGEVACVQADSTLLAPQLMSYTQTGYTFAFYLLDPYGPTGIPLSFVSQIIQAQRHDVMINMPYQDLHKKTGMTIKEQMSAEETALVNNYNAMFGHSHWQDIVQQWHELRSHDSVEGQMLEIQLVDSYRDALQTLDQDLAVKSIPLRFPDKERTMFYLYLTTRDPDGALKMNQILWEAGYQEDDLRYRVHHSKMQKTGQSSLFDVIDLPTEAKSSRDSVEEIGQRLVDALSGKTVTRKDTYRIMADTPYFAKEINQTLTSLKRKGLITYDSPIGNDTLISFK